MKCKKCGREVKMDKDGILYCPFCGLVRYEEVER
ncbi:MAG TPA: hypothetical protein ENF43_02930 [Thermoplasmatales archaeon]|nr:hypothetical protein [Thermoplasmatales archaeon]